MRERTWNVIFEPSMDKLNAAIDDPVIILGNFVDVNDDDGTMALMEAMDRPDVGVLVGPVEARLVLDPEYHREYKKGDFYRKHVYPFFLKCKVVLVIGDVMMSAGTVEKGMEHAVNDMWVGAVRSGRHRNMLLGPHSPIFSTKTWIDSFEWSVTDVPHFREKGVNRFVMGGPGKSYIDRNVMTLQVMEMDGVTVYNSDTGRVIALHVRDLNGYIQLSVKSEGDLIISSSWQFVAYPISN